MKNGLILSSTLLAALLIAPLAAWADANPDFDDDAKPILKMQPGLLRYVESRFEVKDTGAAKYPGDDDHPPGPPYIFRARPIGSHGPYNLRLLIQPGQAGHILGVVDITKVHVSNPNGPAVASRPSEPTEPFDPQQQQQPQPQPEPAPAPASVQVPELSAAPVDQQPTPAPAAQPQQPAPATKAPASQPPTEPTSDTPSGPILDPSSPASNSGQPSLQPPPDPAPSNQ